MYIKRIDNLNDMSTVGLVIYKVEINNIKGRVKYYDEK